MRDDGLNRVLKGVDGIVVDFGGEILAGSRGLTSRSHGFCVTVKVAIPW